jgi:hypothetical protein
MVDALSVALTVSCAEEIDPDVLIPLEPNTPPTALTTPPAVTAAALRVPTLVRPEEPPTNPAALIIPLAVALAALKPPVMVTPVAVIVLLVVTPATVNAPPELMPEALVIEPIWTDAAVMLPAVIAPVVVMAADRSRPVTLIVLATRLPDTELVTEAEPMITESAVGPNRITPELSPVPASSTRSPPTLPETPLA